MCSSILSTWSDIVLFSATLITGAAFTKEGNTTFHISHKEIV